MSSKRRAKHNARRGSKPAHQDSHLLNRAAEALAAGDFAQAERLLQQELAVHTRSRADMRQQAQQLLADLKLAQARQTDSLSARLALLTEALHYSPQHGQVRYELAVALWRMSDFSAAADDLSAIAQPAPALPGLQFFQQLAALAHGRPWRQDGLTPDEINTLALLQELRDKGNPKTLRDRAARTPLVGGAESGWTFLLELMADANAAPQFAPTPPTAVVRYYQGVAAMRRGDAAAGLQAWFEAGETLATPALANNVAAAARNVAADLAQAQNWQAVLDMNERVQRLPRIAENAAMDEIVGIAHFHLGYADAQAGRWVAAADHFRAADGVYKSRHLLQNLALAEEALGQWLSAATAWREMVRRRPRKQDHPDALSDSQVAAIWQRAAMCYAQVDDIGEMITCLKTAVKYTPENLDLRIELVDALLDDARDDAATNELGRILADHPDFVPALLRQGRLLKDRWGYNTMPIWRRVLAAEPDNADARHELAEAYSEHAQDSNLFRTIYGKPLTTKRQLALLEQGLGEIPDHPALLLLIGMFYHSNDERKARDYLQRSIEHAGGDLTIVAEALHELLHVDGDDIVRAMMPAINAVPGMRPLFWLKQAQGVFSCDLGESRAEMLIGEGIRQAEGHSGDDSPAAVYVAAVEICHEAGATKLAQQYEQVLRSRYSTTGAPEYLDALHAFDPKNRKNSRSIKLLEHARSKAVSANESGIVNMVDERIANLKRPPFGAGSPPSPAELMKMLANMSEEEFDEIFGGF